MRARDPNTGMPQMDAVHGEKMLTAEFQCMLKQVLMEAAKLALTNSLPNLRPVDDDRPTAKESLQHALSNLVGHPGDREDIKVVPAGCNKVRITLPITIELEL